MVVGTTQTSDPDFFMYFVNWFQDHVQRLFEFLDGAGELQIKEEDLRSYLSEILFTYIKIGAIYECHQLQTYPSIAVLEEKIQPFLEDLIEECLEAIQRIKSEEGASTDQYWIQNTTTFQSDLLKLFPTVLLKLVRTTFLYYPLYQHSDLPFGLKKYITLTIARLLLRGMSIQEVLDGTNLTIHLAPGAVLKHLYKLTNELQNFIEFTKSYVTKVEFRTYFQISTPFPAQIFQPPSTNNPPDGVIELYTKLTCPACQLFFQSSLWGNLEGIARHLHFPIELIDLEASENNLAYSVGIYGIRHTPTLRYKDRLYKLNPTGDPAQNPQNRMLRELLNQFGLLGRYNPPGEKQLKANSSSSKNSEHTTRMDEENGIRL